MAKVLVLDDDTDLGVLICELLRSRAVADCLTFQSLADLQADPEAVMECDVAILDVNLGPGVPSGIDALAWLRSRGFENRIVFLTGHAATHPLVQRARRRAGVPVLEKPVDVGTLLSHVLPE